MTEARKLAEEFLSDPDVRKEVQAELRAVGQPQLADLIDEAVMVSRAYLAAEAKLAEARGLLSSLVRVAEQVDIREAERIREFLK